MKRLFLLAIAVLAFAGFPQQASAANDDPVTVAKAFYTWFFKNGLNSERHPGFRYQLFNDEIYTYIARGTIEMLRCSVRTGTLQGGAQYFTKTQDYHEDDWAKHTDAKPPIQLGDAIVVPITFGSKQKTSVFVFLKKQEDAWKIFKVVDTMSYP